MPQFRHALICEKVELHPNGSVYTIKNVFPGLVAHKFPFTMGSFSVISFWRGVADEQFNLSFTVIDSKGNILDDIPPETVLLSMQDLQHIQVFQQIKFPRVDTYAININVNGICIEVINLPISLKN